MSKLLLVGAGGNCRSIIDSIDRIRYDAISVVDKSDRVGETICDIPIIGTDMDIPRLRSEGYDSAFITVGSTGNPAIRINLYDILKLSGFDFPAIIDHSAIVSPKATIGKGVFIGKGAIINVGTGIGDFSIINSGSIIDHDCKIGRFVHVAPGVCISGDVTVGNNSHVGIGSRIIQSIIIGENAIIGAGSVVTKDLPPNVVAVGVPCRTIKANEAIV